MGFGDLFKGKIQSASVDDLLDMDDKAIQKALKTRKDIPYKSAKELRKAAKDDRRAFEGEKGIGALIAGLKPVVKPSSGAAGSMGKNYRNIPLKDRVHPAEYKRILQAEAKRQGLL